MTHAQSVTPNHSGLAPSACAGMLVLTGRHPDRQWVSGGWRERTVDVYRCKECGWVISMEANQALNAYPWEKTG